MREATTKRGAGVAIMLGCWTRGLILGISGLLRVVGLLLRAW